MLDARGISKAFRIDPGATNGTLKEYVSGLWKRVAGGRRSHDLLWALRDVSFRVEQGQVLSLLGRNGSGKSTLLRLLCGITEPTSGFVDVRGRIGALLEVAPGFHPELTGRENVYLGGTILGMRQVEIGRRFDEIVAFSGVERFLDQPVKHYSSGMYVRLAFAVAAHMPSEILIIDEALAVGDADFQARCIERLRSLTREGRTILFVSHDLGAVRALSHLAIWLDEGRVQQMGAIKEVADAYEASLGVRAAPSGRTSESAS